MQILTNSQEQILIRERNVLSDLQLSLARFGSALADQETIKKSILQIDDLFLLVVVGEFNSGKSSFINALLGTKILKEGVTPTTNRINIIRYDEQPKETVLDNNTLLINAPIALLKEISIVDTPGTNAIIREHEVITNQFIPRSDMVLFVTSSDRPLSESERNFLQSIRDWGKKLVIVLNKIDLLQNDEELDQVTTFIRDNTRSLLGIEPEIFPLSARSALLAKSGNPALWQTSRFDALENHIQSTLDESGRIKLKFLNPLGVGLNLSNRYLQIIQSRLDLLNEDVGMIENVDRQLAVHKEDMARDFNYRMADIENILFAMEQRGQIFFEENLRLARVPDLLNKNRIQKAFKDEVIADLPQQIETKVNELIDWMVDRDFRQWKAIMDHLSERKQTHQDKIIGDPINASFNFDRNHLIETVARDARQVVEGYDHQIEAEAIADGAQGAVAAAAAIEVGAVGLGTLVTILATTLTADVTGVLVAGAIAVLGLFVIPARRRKANKELTEKISNLRQQLSTSLQTRFNQEIKRSIERIDTAITPYTRFVRAEKQNLVDSHESLNSLQQNMLDLQNQIDKW
jgi:small GTP-binding protein